MRKAEHDFLAWTSFPSSIKYVNDEPDMWTPHLVEGIPVVLGKHLRFEFNAKKQNLTGNSLLALYGLPGYVWLAQILIGTGALDWRKYDVMLNIKGQPIESVMVPNGVNQIAVVARAGWGTPAPGITWFDDLRIYMDDVLIYSDDFSNWSPVIGAGVGAPIGGVAGYLLREPLGPMVSEVVGAVVGGAVGGGVGLLTGLGIIPVPQIPSLGAAPEEPGAPAQLGKYQITG